MKAIAYIRFSSDEQGNGSSIKRQTDNVNAYASQMGLDIIETMLDDGYSASKGHHLSHGKLGKILADAEAGKFKGNRPRGCR
jgi:DNA invertase Pin-like site-specific DNA recombinase